MTLIVTQCEGLTLSGMVWRRYGRTVPGLIERMLAMPENQRLAEMPHLLPMGTAVVIPDDVPNVVTQLVISLWD